MLNNIPLNRINPVASWIQKIDTYKMFNITSGNTGSSEELKKISS